MHKQAIVVRTDLEMGKGKMCAQASHAALEAFLLTQKKKPDWAGAWLAEGQKKIVLRVDSKEGLLQLYEEVKNLLPSALIADAGHTQVARGTITCFASGPAPELEIDKHFLKYKLL